MPSSIPLRSGNDLDGLRAAGILARDVLLAIAHHTKDGATTGDIDRIAAELIKDAGAKSAFLGYRGSHTPFPGTICISLNDEVVHGIGTNRLIRNGDIVKLDVGVLHNGWIGDNALTVAVGEISPRIESLLRATEESLHLAIQNARPGRHLGTLCHSVEAHVKRVGFSVVRQFTGHGVGRNLHEEPSIPNYGRPGSGPLLKKGMVLAIEPMVNEGTGQTKILKDGWTVVTADGKPSAHFEHTILVTDDEPEILTWRPRSFTSAVQLS